MNSDSRHPFQLEPKTETMLQLLVQEHHARELHSAMQASRYTESARPAVTGAELLAYARRERGGPVDFRLEKALRTDPSMSARYRRMMQAHAIGYSQMAMAAGSGSYPERKIGSFGLKIVEDGSETYLILSQEQSQGNAPTVLEAVGSQESVRIPLSSPVRGHIQIVFDKQNSELVRLLGLLREPTTELYLI